MNKFILSLMLTALTINSAGLVLAHEGEDSFTHHGMMGGFYGGMFGVGILGWIFMILVIVAFVLLIIWLIRQIQETEGSRRRRK